MAVIAGPVFLLCVLLMVGVFLFQYHQRAYSHRQRLEVEDPSCDHLYLAKDKTLQDLIYDMSTSGSGSGQYMVPHRCDIVMKFLKRYVVLKPKDQEAEPSSICDSINMNMNDYSSATLNDLHLQNMHTWNAG